MNILKIKLTSFLFVFSLLFAFCSKDPIEQKPQPGGGTGGDKPNPLTASVQFAAQINLTGQPYHSSSLHAEVSVVNEKGEPVLTNKQLMLTITDVVLTEAVNLPVGQYRLTAFRMVHGAVTTRFAAPIANSIKAGQVTKPLSIDFKLQQATPLQVPVEVLKVEEHNRPADFGYPAGAFDNNQTGNDPYAKIRIRAEIRVGDVLYDQIKASLSLTTYSNNGEQTLSFISLKPGINEIPLLKAASSFKLNVTKWGTSSELKLNRADLERDTVYTFSTARDPKVLVAETNFKLVNGKYQPDFKKSYMYEASGKLSEIQYIYRQPDGSNLRGIAERLAYQNGMISSVSRFNERNEKEWSTAFTYDALQRVSGIIHQQDIETTAGTVLYEGVPANSIGIQYVITKPGYRYERHRHQTLRDGNVVEDVATFNNYKMEDGIYDYDDQVNPYYFLKLPDLYLAHGSKNNTINEYRYYYQNNYPEAVPYRSEYTYDADGYPKEVIRHYRSFPGGISKHAFTTKTVFEYR